MANKLILVLALLGTSALLSQNLHSLEAAKNHYKELKELSTDPRPEQAPMDKIVFPSSQYSSGTLIYTMITPEYLTQNEVSSLKSSLQFPANSSEQTRAELDFLLEWQTKRTAAQKDRASNVLAPIGYWPHIGILENHSRYETNREHLFYVGRVVLGEECAADNYPATTALLEGITKDMRLMEFTVKYHLLRPRPYHLEPKLRPLATISSPSFASGHTLWAYIHAFIWSELVPGKRAEFLAVAYEVGESREIMGIHYPSDEEAARVLAHNMLTAMWDNPKFKTDFEKAKSEW
ncbi:phosphatase PAP2 family protein [Spongiimicrobium sp. 2-473A-2-J]|uniref:phosphatase PAP2 family protein n=1 Tax=Eudoraea algarum TaxID=3417568 RepID=UPI003D36F2C3